MTELPQNWTKVPLLTVSDLVRGVTYSKGDAQLEPFNGSTPVLRANNIQDRGFRLTDLVHVPESLVAGKQHVGSGDVVVATSSGSISVVGKAAQALADMNVGFGAFCGLLRPGKAVHAPYFGFFFSSDDYRKAVSSMARGVNINNLKREHFESLELPLAPLAEQKRIADKLEAVLGRVDACRARLDRVPALLKRFRQSVLAAATSGKLTEEWREERNATGGAVKTLGEVIRVSSGKALTAKNMAEGGAIPVFGGNGINGYHNEGNVFEETLVIGRVGYYCGCVHMTPTPAWVTDNALIVRHDPTESEKRFLFYALRALDLRTNDAATAQPVISGQKIYSLPLKLPSLPEQQEIVRRVEALFAFADRIEARLATARKTVERLTPATLAKAFRGELVPQAPNDEPASALLERLLAQNDSTTAKPKRGRRAESTSA